MNMMILKRIFKAIDEKINDNDLINGGVDFKFESDIEISFLNKCSQSL